MTETELTIVRETQQLLDERLKLLDAEMAMFLHLDGPARAVASEVWFRSEIAKAVTPLLARIMQLETKPLPAMYKPSKQFEDALFGAIGQFIADELKERDQRIAALEAKMANWKYCGVWAEGQQYEIGNFVTHGGSLFTCLWSTQGEPGTVDAWQLCCKRGKDARDIAESRQATQGRTYGR
jgi:hypothetical protein